MTFKICRRCKKEYRAGRNSKYCSVCRKPKGRTSCKTKHGWVKHRNELYEKYGIKI